MIRIAISAAAFEAIKATLPLGAIGTLCAGDFACAARSAAIGRAV